MAGLCSKADPYRATRQVEHDPTRGHPTGGGTNGIEGVDEGVLKGD